MDDSLIVREASGTVAEVLGRLTAVLESRGVVVFARIDHAAKAREAGLPLEDEVLLVFGSPDTGTALMQADRRAGLDLPLRMLVWSEVERTMLAYHDPLSLPRTYAVAGMDSTLQKLAGLMQVLVTTAQAGNG